MKGRKTIIMAVLLATFFFSSQFAIADGMLPVPIDRLWKEYTFSWTSNGSGVATSGASIHNITGYLIQAHAIASGASDNYDVWLVDENGADLLMGMGADFDSEVTSPYNYRPIFARDPSDDTRLTHPFLFRTSSGVSVNNAGATKTGTFKIIVR